MHACVRMYLAEQLAATSGSARKPKPPLAQPTANAPRRSLCSTKATPPPKSGARRSSRAEGSSSCTVNVVSKPAASCRRSEYHAVPTEPLPLVRCSQLVTCYV